MDAKDSRRSLNPLLAALALAWSCTPQYDPCFPPGPVVRDLEILAIRADPPEGPLEGGTVHVRALVEDARADAGPFEVAVRTCSPGAPRCDSAPLRTWTAGRGELSFDVEVSASQIAAARAADPLHGYPQTRVLLDLQAGSARATKLLLFSDAPQKNAAFDFDGFGLRRIMHIDRAPYAEFPPDEEEHVRGDAIQLFTQEQVWLRPHLTAGAQEAYDVTDLSGHRERLVEQISYTFRTSTAAGEFEEETASELPVEKIAAFRYLHVGGGSGTLWIIARDSRGAQAWLAVPFAALDQRLCYVSRSRCPLLEIGCL